MDRAIVPGDSMTPARLWWKQYYRMMRVCRREVLKAAEDMMIYGTGAVFYGKGTGPRYAPFSQIPKEGVR